MTPYFDSASTDIQLRLRVSDWAYIASNPLPGQYEPGPGPFVDDIRIGRLVLTGPVVSEGADARTQAQDAAANDPAFEAGPLYSPANGGDIFGPAAFSRGGDLGNGGSSANLIVGDSITVQVQDVLGNGGLVVEWYGAIVRGPHAGKAPPPYTAGSNGFFVVTADSSRDASGQVITDHWFVDLDDTYFRGGDELRYFWWATDAQGGAASLPQGLAALPATLAEAEAATGGLFEVSFLPAINWDAGYLTAIAQDPHGDIDPTPAQVANSSQRNCILYVQNVNTRRRSSDLNRTSFMYLLDLLGYRGHYDVYDHSGMGNTNNQLGSRMSPEQARNYVLLVYDAGNSIPGTPILPDGNSLDSQKIDMSTWFQSWNMLSGAPNAPHTLWILAANALEEKPFDPLYASMQVALGSPAQSQGVNPDVLGVADFTHHPTCQQSHQGDVLVLAGGCPDVRDYDALTATGGGVMTHVFAAGEPSTEGAIVMNTDGTGFTTILQSFPWFDLQYAGEPGLPLPGATLMAEILQCTLPLACQDIECPDPGCLTDAQEDPDLVATPERTVLHPNTPNPFNPTTTIHFDLARDGRVSLRIYDVAGRLVRTLLDAHRTAGFHQQAAWNGLDDTGRRVGSGLYLYRLVAGDVTALGKMVVLK